MNISESLVERRKKLTATLAWCADLERKYVNGETKNPPHLLNVCVAIGDGMGIWWTIELYSSSPNDVIQGWDIKFNKFRTLPYEQVIEVEINSLSYIPATEMDWKERIEWTNLQYNPDLEIRQSKGIFG